MKRFILAIGATVALAITSVVPVAASHAGPLAGSCPDDFVLIDGAYRSVGGGPTLIKRLVLVDHNGDGHMCVRSSETKLIRITLTDNNGPLVKRLPPK